MSVAQFLTNCYNTCVFEVFDVFQLIQGVVLELIDGNQARVEADSELGA